MFENSPSNHECAWKAKQVFHLLACLLPFSVFTEKKKLNLSSYAHHRPQLLETELSCTGLKHTSWDTKTVQWVK